MRPSAIKEAIAQLPAIATQANAAYETLCTHRWKPSGPFAGWLSEYRNYLTSERVPKADDISDRTREQLEIQGVDTNEFHSSATMDAARDFLKRMNQIYTERLARPMNVSVDEYGGTGFAYGKY